MKKNAIDGDPDNVDKWKSPLWNNNETDVLPEYQLTYGHIICQAAITQEKVKALGEYLNVRSLIYEGDFDASLLPTVLEYRTLGTEKETHLFVAEIDSHNVIFGPHKLFLSSRRWTDWNKHVGGLMAYITQDDTTDFFYTVFLNGERLLDICSEGDSLRYLEQPRIVAYLEGKQIYNNPGGKPQSTEEIDALIASDARIINEDGEISVRRFPSNQPVKNVRHYIFDKPLVTEPKTNDEQHNRSRPKWYIPWTK